MDSYIASAGRLRVYRGGHELFGSRARNALWDVYGRAHQIARHDSIRLFRMITAYMRN